MTVVNGILFLHITNEPRACGAAVAQGTHNPLVVGSNPSGPKLKKLPSGSFFYWKFNSKFPLKI